jgi:hypothetical protein
MTISEFRHKPRRRRNPWAPLIGLLVKTALVIGGITWLGCFLQAEAAITARKTACWSSLRELYSVLMAYANDHGGHLPPAARWEAACDPYLRNSLTFRCPQRGESSKGHGDAFNRALDRALIAGIRRPERTPLLFTSTRDAPNTTDHLESLWRGSHGTGWILFADGRVERCPDPGEASQAPSR